VDLRLVPAAAAVAVALFCAAPGAALARSGTLVALRGEVAPALAPTGLGAALPRVPAAGAELSRRLTLTLTLRRSDEAGFRRFLARVTDRRSRDFGHYLSQRALADRFGPTAVAYGAVVRWARASGWRVLGGSANRLTITVRATLAQAARALHLRFAEYRLGSRSVYANVQDPQVPAVIARTVRDIAGLSNLAVPSAPRAAPQTVTIVQSTCLAPLGAATGATVKIAGLGELGFAIAKAFGAVITQLSKLGLVGFGYGAWCAGWTGIGAFQYGYCIGAAMEIGAHAWDSPQCGQFKGFPNYCRNFGVPSISTNCRSGAADTRRRSRSGRIVPHATSPPAAAKIGLLEYDTFHRSDVADWLSLGLSPASMSALSEVPVNGGVATPGPGEQEVLTDVDSVMYLNPLPGTQYVVYDAPPSTSFQTMFNAMLNDGDTVISNSWAQCENETSVADAQAIDSILAQAEASGVTIVNGTGDHGGTCLDGAANTISVPADSPHAIAVGGTSMNAPQSAAQALGYPGEAWWNGASATPATGAGGFGVSRYFARPSYQDGLTSSAMRSVPDVAEVADPEDGLLICQADAGGCPTGQAVGGTSLAAPELAGLVSLGHGLDVSSLYTLQAVPGVFHNAASMGSDFAHVGLGSIDVDKMVEAGENVTAGPVSPAVSLAVGAGQSASAGAPTDVPADGSTQGVIDVELLDANGIPVSGRTVTLTPSGGTSAVLSASSGTSDASGRVAFAVTDTTAEPVTFTVTDTTDNVTLAAQPTLTFVTPVATGASISGGPTTVANDGSGQATISVYLQDALGRPAAGKTVSLSQGTGHAVLAPGPTAITDASGTATFTATDTTQESVFFTATDVTDGNLPVPGSMAVTFQPGSPCADTVPTMSSGYSAPPFASGLPTTQQDTTTTVDGLTFTYDHCSALVPAVFDGSGNAFMANSATGSIFEFGPGGGAPTALPGSLAPGGQLAGLVFGKDGALYAGLDNVGGDFRKSEIVQLVPGTGQVERVIASGDFTSQVNGLPPCPAFLAVDPVSGDLFSDDFCSGAIASTEIARISNPSSSNPVVSSYATLGSGFPDELAFSPDGTLYAADSSYSCVNPSHIISVGVPSAGVANPTSVATLAGGAGEALAIGSVNGAGQPTSFYTGTCDGAAKVDPTVNPATVTPIATGGPALGNATIGPDGCLYFTTFASLLKIDGPGLCAAASGPQITLTAAHASAPTGSPVTLTAQLSNFPSASGTAVHFVVNGPNAGARLSDANGSGQATVTDDGVLEGVDTVTAAAVSGGRVIASAPVQVRWTSGQDTTSVDLNLSQEGGPAGASATVTASLVDVSRIPASAIAGQTVRLTLGMQSCSAQTDSAGVAGCRLIPPSVGLFPLTATFAGTAQYTASTATTAFVATTGAPVNTSLPRISGTNTPGGRLTCTTGAWSNSPIRFTYRWSRDGRPIAGATKASYTVQIADEAHTLTCVVTASNTLGAGRSATSDGVLVALPGTLKCPKPSGRLRGGSLGPLKLGMTRAAARRRLKRFGVTYNNMDNFCLYAGWGIRAGYPSAKLLGALARAERRRVAGRVILLLSANTHYALGQARPGGGVTRRLHLGTPFRIGRNQWYVIHGTASMGVLKVRAGVIQEVGIASLSLTRGRAAQRRLLTSFTAAKP
jgi:hypothetical protein